MGSRFGAGSILLTAMIRGVAAISVIGMYFVASRLYGESDSSLFYVLVTSSAVATPVLLFGFNAYAVRRLAITASASEASLVFGDLGRLFVRVLSGVAVCCGLIAFVFRLTDIWGSIALLSLVYIIPLFSFVGFCLQGLSSLNCSIAVLNLLNPIFVSLFAVSFSIAGFAPGSARAQICLAFGIGSVCTLISAVVLWFRALGGLGQGRKLSAGRSPSMVDKSQLVELWAVYVLVALNNWSPQILFYFSGNSDSFSHFSVAQRMANIIGFFIIVSNFVLAPKIAALHHEGALVELEALYVRVARLSTTLAAPFAVILAVWPSLVLSAFGDGYSAGAKYLSLLALVQLFNVATGSSSLMLTMTGNQRWLLTALGSAFGLAALFLAIFGHRHGAFGFALTVAVAIVWQNAMAAFYVWRCLGISLMKAFVPDALFVRLSSESGA